MEAKKKTITAEKIGCFIFFYLAIFGPKIGTYIDISFFSNLLVLMMCSGRYLRLFKDIKPIVMSVIGLIGYSILVAVFCQNLDYLFLFKFFRVLVAVLAISSYIGTCKLEQEDIYSCAATVLLIHAIIVIIGTLFWPQLQEVIRPLSGYTKQVRSLRSTGLTNGYDFAGMLCCFGIITTYFGKKSSFSSIRLLIFIIASLFTSRMSMLITEAIIFYIVIINRKHERVNKKLLGIIFVVSIIPILGIFLFSTKNYDNPIVNLMMKNETFRTNSNRLIYYYASGSIGDTLQGHYYFEPLSSMEKIFGSMTEAHQDPGITQYIYEIGIVGLLMTIFCYIKIMINSARYKEYDRDLFTCVILMCLLSLVMSVKNSYLFARHVTECIFIFYSILTIRYYNAAQSCRQ